jgi:hypothetical protein
MAVKSGRGGSRPGAGRKPVPVDDVARMVRMSKSDIPIYQISKELHYDRKTVRSYIRKAKNANE